MDDEWLRIAWVYFYVGIPICGLQPYCHCGIEVDVIGQYVVSCRN